MKILSFDSSGMTASVAFTADGVLIAEYTINHKKTHSETLLPMLDQIVRDAELTLEDIDAIAIAAGPGSFTGLRIGAATVKGLGLALEKPVIPVPTCEALAYNLCGVSGLTVPIMDARRGQVYTGIYRENAVAGKTAGYYRENAVTGETSGYEVVLDQTALSIEELLEKLDALGEPVTFLGDGVPVFRKVISEKIRVPYTFAPPQSALQRAASVAALGEIYARGGRITSADAFAPIYLRKSQAEREHEAAARERLAEDISSVAEMESEMFTDAWSPEAVSDSLKYPYNHILLISSGGEIRTLEMEENVADSFVVGEEQPKTAGYMIYADPAGEAELHRIAVLPEFRRKGLARKLMERLISVEEGPIFLEVRAGNAPAIGLYTSLGFKELDRRKNYYRNPDEDAVVMQRQNTGDR